MKLLQLILTNFKGIKSLTIDPQGKNVSIFGKNATGKTTVCDSVSWLLFDKDSKGNAKFDIKTLDGVGESRQGLEHGVEGHFIMDDGKIITLKKVYFEKWTKKRGQALATCTGNTTKHYVDTVPVAKGAYTKEIKDIADEETFKLLTSPTYFADQLHWTKRRELLLDICGDVSDKDVIDSNKELYELTEILNDKSCDDTKKIINATRKEINENIQKIPVRIDEVELGLPELPTNIPELKADLEKLTHDKNNADQVLVMIKEGGRVAELEKNLAIAEKDVLISQNADMKEKTDENKKLLAQIDAVKTFISEKVDNRDDAEKLIAQHLEAIKRNGELLDISRAEYKEIKESEFVAKGECCPTCAALPEHQVNYSLEKFNLQKADSLAANVKAGGELVKMNDTLQENINKCKEISNAILEELKPKNEELASLNEQYKTLNKQVEKTELTGAEKNRDLIKDEIELLKSNGAEELEKAELKVVALQVKIDAIDAKLITIKDRAEGEKRIKELKKEEKDLAIEFEKLEKQLYLIDLFTKTKVNMLEGNINRKFEMAKFKLFNVQINAGIEPCCEVVFNGVPYSTGLNDGHKILVGMDIIKTLRKHFGFTPLVFVDNSESITNEIKCDGQLIKFYASKKDDVLRVEAG